MQRTTAGLTRRRLGSQSCWTRRRAGKLDRSTTPGDNLVKSDLDRLMSERGYDAILVVGPSGANPPLYYLTNGVSLGERTLVVKKRGEAAVIIANSMEREKGT